MLEAGRPMLNPKDTEGAQFVRKLNEMRGFIFEIRDLVQARVSCLIVEDPRVCSEASPPFFAPSSEYFRSTAEPLNEMHVTLEQIKYLINRVEI